MTNIVTAVEEALTSGVGYAESILIVAATVLALFIGWKLIKRAAKSV